MEGEETGSAGPDLGRGIELSRLREGEPLVGHLGDEAVLLVRYGEEVLAVGARCTHYGGPLAEGLVDAETVRCPWHHACFSLRTGEPLSAPAVNPLPRWEVEVKEGVVQLGKRRLASPLDALGRRAEGPESVVVVGAGAAGSAAAETLRREGYEGRIAMIDPDEPAPYDRPNLSKDFLAGTAPEAWIPLRPPGFYEENGVDRITTAAVGIDAWRRRVTLSDGHTVDYGALLLATGAVPARLDVPGAGLPHVFLLRSLADCRAIIRSAEDARRAVVVGSGFIGMEAAASLRIRGLEVTVVSPDEVPFQRTLGTEIGRRIRRVHRENGVSFRPGRRVVEVDERRVVLDDGDSLPADLVVVGIGVRPDVALAETAELRVDDGVLVDSYLRTSAPRIFAAGDVARWSDPRWGPTRIEHWVVAQRQGRTAARNMLGRLEPFRSVPFFWTQQFDLAVSYVGHAPAWDEAIVDGDPRGGDFSVRYVASGRTAAVATVGRDGESLRAELRMEREAVAAEIR